MKENDMPNWCENFMRLEVPNKEEADKIIAVLNSDEDDGLLNYLYPEPKEDYDDSKTSFPDWYGWRTTNWGTKWDVNIEHYELNKNSDGSYTFEFNFDSAWSPPVGVYDKVSQREGWNVFATYIEGGMDFMGYFEDGQDYSYQAATRSTTDAPDWLVDDYSWHYDYQEENEQEDDVDMIVKGEMTHDAFIIKWGIDTYNQWSDFMKPGTGDPQKKEVNNA